MPDLDAVLKKSLAQASSHSKKVFGQNPLTGQEVLDMANSRVLILAATVKPEGRPHVSPADLVALDGKLYVGIDESTARYKNLKHNSAITLMLAEDWKRQAILEGNANFLDMKTERAKKVSDAQKKKYGWVTDALAEFSPEKAFTWKAK